MLRIGICLFLVTGLQVHAQIGKAKGAMTKTVPAMASGNDGAPRKVPDNARLRLGSDKFREANYISASSLSPDGKTLALCANSTVIRFVDLATGKELRRVTVREYLRTNQMFWTADGKQMLTTGYSGINLWDVSDGRLVRQVTNADKTGRDGTIGVSADGNWAVVGTQYENGTVRVIDLVGKKEAHTVKPMQNSSVFGALSPNGDHLATWGQHYNRGNGKAEDEAQVPRTLQVWDKEGKEKFKIVSDIPQIQAVRFSPDGTKLAAAGNGTVQLWDVATGKLERRFAGRTGIGMMIVFSPDGKLLSASGQDGTVQSWDVASGKRAGVCEGPAPNVTGLQYRPDNTLVAWATIGNAIEIWEVPSGKRLTPEGGHSAPVTSLHFARDGKTLLSAANDGKILRWDLATGKELEPFTLKESESKRRMYGYARNNQGPTFFSPNGKYLIASGSNGGAAVWDLDAGVELFALTSPQGYVDRNGIIAFSADSSKLIAMGRYGRDQAFAIPLWEMETGVPLPTLKGQKGDFTAAGFSTDGSILTTCAYVYTNNGSGGPIAEAWSWDLATGKVLSKVIVPQMQFQSLHYLDHRLFVALGNTNNRSEIQNQKIHDAVTGGESRTLENSANLGGGNAVALSPDRRLLAYGFAQEGRFNNRGQPINTTRKVVIWEVATGSIRHEVAEAPGWVTSVAFSPDGRSIATGCSDTTIYLWDLDKKVEAAAEPLSPADLDESWKALESPNAKTGEAAIRKLMSRPAEAVAMLTERLKPSSAVKLDAERIAKLITDLDSARFAVREAAMRDLESLGRQAKGPVEAGLAAENLSPEVRERLEKLREKVNKPDTGEEWVRPIRSIETLERIGTPEARGHLAAIAGGGDTPTTRHAKDAVKRLESR